MPTEPDHKLKEKRNRIKQNMQKGTSLFASFVKRKEQDQGQPGYARAKGVDSGGTCWVSKQGLLTWEHAPASVNVKMPWHWLQSLALAQSRALESQFAVVLSQAHLLILLPMLATYSASRVHGHAPTTLTTWSSFISHTRIHPSTQISGLQERGTRI